MPLVYVFQAVLPVVRAVARRCGDVVVVVTLPNLDDSDRRLLLEQLLSREELAAFDEAR